MRLFLKICLSLLFASQAHAASFELADFLFHLKTTINYSKTIADLNGQVPGTLAEKTEFLKVAQTQKIAGLPVPHAKTEGTKLILATTPPTVIDFAKLNDLKLTVNGHAIDLKSGPDWITQFRSATSVSLYDSLIGRAYAQSTDTGTVETLTGNLKDRMGAGIHTALSKVVSASEDAYVSTVITFARCQEGIDDCPFMSHSATIIERLGHDEMFHGLKQFKCANGKLQDIEAAEATMHEAKVPSYHFTYDKKGVAKIHVVNFNSYISNGAACDFSYNDKTKEVKTLTNSPRCAIMERQNLNTIGFDTPVGPAYRCCETKTCEERVLAWMNSPDQKGHDKGNTGTSSGKQVR